MIIVVIGLAVCGYLLYMFISSANNTKKSSVGADINGACGDCRYSDGSCCPRINGVCTCRIQ